MEQHSDGALAEFSGFYGRCDRDDSVGLWVCRTAEDPPDAEPWPPASTGIAVDGSRPARALAPSLAMV